MMSKSHRAGVLAHFRKKVKQGKGGKNTVLYLEAILKDPCVYCGEMGCDSFDHINPVVKNGKHHWSNFAPCHKTCNMRKGAKGVLWNRLAVL